jgi:hypothetical protein
MLRALEIVDVGPAPRLRMEMGPRLNVLAGDNGLGKSFLLEILWWTLTGTWTGLPAWPRPGERVTPEISVEIDRSILEQLDDLEQRGGVELEDSLARLKSRFNFSDQEWEPPRLAFMEAPLPALVLYARADGTFAVWDPDALAEPGTERGATAWPASARVHR